MKERVRNWIKGIAEEIVENVMVERARELVINGFLVAFRTEGIDPDTSWFGAVTSRVDSLIQAKVKSILFYDLKIIDVTKEAIESRLQFLESEQFIDKVVERINRKQLGQ